MGSYSRIRRDRSALSNGLLFGKRRRGISPLFLILWLISMGAVGLVIWQFNSLQPRVLAVFNTDATPTLTAVEYARRGDQAFWQGDLNAAVSAYRVAAQLAPTNVDMLYELARVLIYRSYGDNRNLPDIGDAEQVATRAAEGAPNNARAWTIYCFALVRSGGSKTGDAVRACLRAMDINPNLADAHAYLSMAYYDLARFSAAQEQAEEAVRLDPNSIDANTALARALTFQGQFSAAMQYYQRAASINPSLEFPWFEMGGFAYNLGNRFNGDEARYRVAINAYNTVLSRNPNSVKAYTRLCQTYLAKGEAKDAQEYCVKATEIDPGYTPAWRWLGEVRHRSRNYEDAIESLQECAKQEEALGIPKENRDPICWWLRGVDYFILGKCKEQAVPILEDVLTWTTDPIAIRETNKTLAKCADDAAYRGTYKTPTPVPTATPRPTPIL